VHLAAQVEDAEPTLPRDQLAEREVDRLTLGRDAGDPLPRA